MSSFLEIVLSNSASALLLALVVMLVEPRLRRPGVVHALWLVVLLRLLAPPIFSLPMTTNASWPAAEGLLTIPTVDVESTAPGTALGSVAPAYRPGLVELWGVGLVVLLGLAVVRTRSLWRALAQAKEAPPEVTRRITTLASRMDIAQPPRTHLLSAEVSPMLWSAFGATRLILPAKLLECLEDDELDALLAHELAHLKRGDHWVRHLELLVKLLFWWHPVAWWASRRLHRAEEQCCDILVRQTLPEHRRAYADCLLKTMSYLAGSKRPTAALASGMGAAHNLKGRLVMILSQPLPCTLPKSVRLLVAATCLLALAFFPTLAQEGTTETFSGEPLAVAVNDAKLVDVLSRLAEVSGLNFIITPGTDLETRVWMEQSNIPWDQALDQVLQEVQLPYALQGNILWIGNAQPTALPSGPFTGEPISLHFEQMDLREVFVAFGRWADLEIVLEEGISGTATLELKDVPWDQALSAVLRINGLESTLEGEVLRVHRP